MKTIFESLKINKIIFETGDSDVIVNTNIQQGGMSYESDIVINHSDLNALINRMQQKVNENIDISSLFESEKMYNGNLLYTLDVEKVINEHILIDSMSFNNHIKQIRA